MSDVISRVLTATDTDTRDISVDAVLKAIRTGGRKLRGQITQIRNRFEAELAITGGDLKAAKRAIAPLKVALPAVMWCGQFRDREQPAADKLQKHSGLFPADLDSLGDKLPEIRKKLEASPHVFALFLSPSGDGLKPVFRVRADASLHAGSFRAVEAHVKQLTGIEIDESGKDIGRLCFMSYDPDIYVKENAIELEPLPEPEKPKPAFTSAGEVNLSERQRIATEMFGGIEWDSDTHGFSTCPGKHLHTQPNLPTDCEIHLDGAPNIHCFHKSCKGIVAGANHELQSRIGKAEKSAAKAASEQSEPPLPPERSAATRLVKLAEGFEFFHDRQDRPFVRLEESGHTEVWPVESTKFRKLLARMFYKHTGKAINRNAVGDAITTLAGKASYDGSEEPVFLRVAPHGENILIDLCDAEWRVVEVTPEGWQILDHSPVAFIRTGSMQSFPVPVKGRGSIAPLWKLLNVSEAQRPLVAGALLNHFRPRGPYFVVIFVGEQGTAKSYGAKTERQLVDPNENPLRSPSKEERDLMAHAANNWCVCFDNLSSLPLWLSDGLCRLSTGGGHSARTLYTDLEEVSLAVKRPVILNGIEDLASRPDLAERALQIELEEIPKANRMTEEELDKMFAVHSPVIFTGILDGLAQALRNQKTVKLKNLPRMADATKWVTAGETAFGFKPGAFIEAYSRNLDESAMASVEAHAVGVGIVKLLEAQNQWSGTATELLEALRALLTEEERRAKEKDKDWPQDPRSLGHALRRLAPSLRRAGYSYQRGRSQRRIIQICKVGKTTSRTTRTSTYYEERPTENDDVDDVFPTLHVSTSGSDHQGLDEAPPGPASVPSTITQEMASALQANGYSQPAICKMTPGEAHRILSSSPGRSKAVSGDLKL